MRVLILAAGYATRLYPLTRDVPKALLPIGGKPMLDYLVERLAEQKDLGDMVIVTNHRFAEQFRQWTEAAQPRYGRRFAVLDDGSHSDADKLGAMGDIAFAIDRAEIDDDLLIAASDNFLTFSLDGFLKEFQTNGCDTLLARHIDSAEDLKRFAVAKLDEKGFVTELVEKPEVPPSDLAVYALYLYRRDTLPLVKTYLAQGNSPDAPGHFPEWLVKRRALRVHIFDGELIDIGTPESYRAVAARYEGGVSVG